MTNNIQELKEIFEYELKTKLSEKAKRTLDEIKTLLNCFKYYDTSKEGFVDESTWINAILRTGITGFSQNDLEMLYTTYVVNPSDNIDYQKFCDYIFGRENISKMSYNKIKNKKLKTDLIDRSNNNNYYYKRNNFQNIDLNKYNKNYYNKQKEYESVTNIKINNNFELLIDKFKEKINTNNGVTYYTLLKNLKTNEEKLSQTVSIDELSISIQPLRLNISSNDIYEFFNYLDEEKIGRVSTNNIIGILLEPINERRIIYLNKVFKHLDTDKKGEISINKLKNSYIAKNHPDIINNNKTEDEIYNQFCYTLDIYIRINNIQNYTINNDQFIDYYTGISPSIKTDKDFENILEQVYELDKKQKEKKKYVNIIYKNYYEENQEDSEMGINSLFFGQSHSKRPKYDYNYDYLEEFYKSSGDITNNNINNNINNNRTINSYNNKIHFRNKTQSDLAKDALNNKLLFNTLNNNNVNNNNINTNTIKNTKKYFLYESSKPKENTGIRIFKKIRYNPITDQYIKESNSFNNGYTNINDIMNNKEKTKNENEELIKEEINVDEEKGPKNNKNIIYNFSNTYNNNSLKENEALIKFRNLLISQGVKGIFKFQKLLSIYDRNNSGLISFDNFLTIFQSNYINVPISDIKLIFSLFDDTYNYNNNFINKENENNNNEIQINNTSEYKIKYDSLIKSLVGNLPIKRKILIQKAFNSFNKDSNNRILISDIKNKFNSGKHPLVLQGAKTEIQILSEFLNCLETFREYYNNLHGGYSFNMGFQEFCDFLSEISMSIDDDIYFQNLIINCFVQEKYNIISENEEKNENNYAINNKYKKITNVNNNNNDNNKQENKNMRRKVGEQIINNKIFY